MENNKRRAYCIMLVYNFINGDINMKYHTLMCSVESEREIYLDDGSMSKEYDVIPVDLIQESLEHEINDKGSIYTTSEIYEDYDIALEKCHELNKKYNEYKDSHKVLSYGRF